MFAPHFRRRYIGGTSSTTALEGSAEAAQFIRRESNERQVDKSPRADKACMNVKSHS
jgi:hypothetical protein